MEKTGRMAMNANKTRIHGPGRDRSGRLPGVAAAAALGLALLWPAVGAAQFDDLRWSGAFALSGGGHGGLQAAAGPNRTMVMVPGPTHYIEDSSDATQKAPFMVWDGLEWRAEVALPGGCGNLFPADVAMRGSELIVGGGFTNLCGTGINYLARYDAGGQAWAAVAAPVDSPVLTVEWDGNDRLYVGGQFGSAGNVQATRIFYEQQGVVHPLFDSGTLTQGTNLAVRDIGLGDGGILAVGDFTTAGGQTGGTCCIAKWNPGTETWSMYPEIEAGLSMATINDVLATGSQIYLGGAWNRPSEPAENQPSKAAVGGSGGWSFLGEDPRGPVVEIASSGGGVFFASDFFDVDLGDGNPGSGPNLAEWAGNWLPLGDNGLDVPADLDILGAGKLFITQNNTTRLATVSNDTLVAAGSALWNPTTASYEPLGHGVGHVAEGINEALGTVRAMAEFEGKLVIGGFLNFAGIQRHCCGLFARTPDNDAAPWTTLGDFEGDVWALQVFGGQLWVGGSLTSAGGQPAASIARYSAGGAWSVPDNGLPSGISIRALHVHGGQLYAGATSPSGGNLTGGNMLFRWTGSSWQRVTGTGLVGKVVALASFQNELHAAGAVPLGPGMGVANVGRLSGNAFVRLGNGISGSDRVSALRGEPGQLIVGGLFSGIDGTPMRSVAAWNGTTWSPLGSGLGSDGFSRVLGLGRFQERLIAVGTFGDRGDGTLRSISRIAWFDGSDWQPLQGGLVDMSNPARGHAHVVLPTNDSLWVGGQFDLAGGRGFAVAPAMNVARLGGTLEYIFVDRFQ
jgi:hypothetical protein